MKRVYSRPVAIMNQRRHPLVLLALLPLPHGNHLRLYQMQPSTNQTVLMMGESSSKLFTNMNDVLYGLSLFVSSKSISSTSSLNAAHIVLNT